MASAWPAALERTIAAPGMAQPWPKRATPCGFGIAFGKHALREADAGEKRVTVGAVVHQARRRSCSRSARSLSRHRRRGRGARLPLIVLFRISALRGVPIRLLQLCPSRIRRLHARRLHDMRQSRPATELQTLDELVDLGARQRAVGVEKLLRSRGPDAAGNAREPGEVAARQRQLPAREGRRSSEPLARPGDVPDLLLAIPCGIERVERRRTALVGLEVAITAEPAVRASEDHRRTA